MMNCKAKLRNLGDLVEGSAPFVRRLSFHMHILMCWRCRRYFKQFKLMHKASNEVLPEDLPQDFFQVMDKALQRLDSHS